MIKQNKRAAGISEVGRLIMLIIVILIVIFIAEHIYDNAHTINELKDCGNMPGTYCYEDAECASPLDQHMEALDEGCEEKDEQKKFCCYTTQECFG